MQNSYLCIKTDNAQTWLETMLRFWYKFVRDVSVMLSKEESYRVIETPWKFCCLG